MKASQLPINTMVLLVIAIIILIAVVALFYMSYSQTADNIDLTAAKNNACSNLINMGCIPPTDSVRVIGFDSNDNGDLDNGDTLRMLCENHYMIYSDSECKTFCGCKPQDTV